MEPCEFAVLVGTYYVLKGVGCLYKPKRIIQPTGGSHRIVFYNAWTYFVRVDGIYFLELKLYFPID